jgi:hypothetical protein
VAAWLSLKLLQSKKSAAFVDNVSEATADGVISRPKHFAGRTMDLTLFAVMRAVDVVVGELWSQRKGRRIATGQWSMVTSMAQERYQTKVLTISPGGESSLRTHRLVDIFNIFRSNHVGMDL